MDKLCIPSIIIDRLAEVWLDRWKHGPFCPREVTQKDIDERRPVERNAAKRDLFNAVRLIAEAGGRVVWEPVPAPGSGEDKEKVK